MRGFPQYLVKRGWDVHIVSSPGPALQRLSAVAGVRTHEIRMAREPSPAADVKALFAWLRLLARVRPDLIFVGTPKAALLGGIAAWIARVPRRIYLLRGLRMETESGAKRMALAFMERVAMWVPHRVVSVSPSLRARVVELGLVAPQKISVVGAGSSNGVDIAGFDRSCFKDADLELLRTKHGIDAEVPVVGFVGRLTEDKGLSVLADARALLLAAGVDYQLLVVGGVDSGTVHHSLDRVRSFGRAPIETGRIDDPAIYYQLMDLLCLPTLREGFPNVILEAAASGIPAITTTATGAVDSVVDGKTGLLVPPADSAALAEALRTLLADTELRRRMGASALKNAEGRFAQVPFWDALIDFLAMADTSAFGARPSPLSTYPVGSSDWEMEKGRRQNG